MGKSTISMAIFNCYVSSPEGNFESVHPVGSFHSAPLRSHLVALVDGQAVFTHAAVTPQEGHGLTQRQTKRKHLPKMAVTNMVMGNGPFIVDFPIKNGDFPWQNVSSPEGTY